MAFGVFFNHGESAYNLYAEQAHQPRWRNVMFARFVPHDDAVTDMLAETGQAAYSRLAERFAIDGEGDRTLYSRIVRVSGPDIRPSVTKINQYNRRKNIVTGYDYGDMTLEWRDTADSAALAFWDLYYAYLFKQAAAHTANGRQYEGADDVFDDATHLPADIIEQYGIRVSTRPRRANFFKRFELYHMGQGHYVRTDIANPEISAFAQSELAYEDASTASHTMTISPENVRRVRLIEHVSHDELEAMLTEAVGGFVRNPTEGQLAGAADFVTGMSRGPRPDAPATSGPAGTGVPDSYSNSPYSVNIAGFEEFVGGGSLNRNEYAGSPGFDRAFTPAEGATGSFRRTLNGQTHIWNFNNGQVTAYGSRPAEPGEHPDQARHFDEPAGAASRA